MMLTPVILALLLWFCDNPQAPEEIGRHHQTVTSVTVSPDSMALNVGEIGRATCEPRNKFGTLLTNTCTWVSRDTTVAKPTSGSQTSSVTARKVGKTWVVATSSKKDSLLVRVVDTVTPPPSGIVIAVGDNWQAKVDANPANTTFRILAGTHVRQSVTPKAGDQFLCAPGAVMDGQKVTAYAFQRSGADPDSVTIKGCRITQYNPPVQMGAILAGGHTAADGTTGWVVDSNEIDNNANGGIRLGGAMKVRWNKIHHNSQIGIVGVGDDILVDGNEIAYNNPTNANLGFEAGGTKFVKTNRLIVRNNFAHHNHGPALWADIANVNYLFDGNRVEDNNGDAIAIEISYGGIIRNNVVRRNGPAGWGFGTGIIIAASGGSGIEVTGNTVEMAASQFFAGVGNGIILMQQNRGTNYGDPAGVDPVMLTQNVSVHDNTVEYHGSGSPLVAGAMQDNGDQGVYTRNNHFEHNTYNLVGAQANPFAWITDYRTDAQWRAAGNDTTGTFTR